ncbi:4-carboxymuconolactone decarboxylase-like protein [Dendryphion nanum]|uniref:4-carboxymuconolactone decarboxylase-like protein n=1 Tax=Dendryphion nanum TaxID=256645 RepID=A0A9P9D7A6_9PLEO|nr:4-carboxymuconolactone decarboxylase-like protein [Dendryphion nanum]
MRLPYVATPLDFPEPEDHAIVQRVQQRRGDAGLLELDLSLLHAPPVADGWNSFLGAIRTKTTISTSIREIAICRVAVLNKAWYEWDHHAPLLRECQNMDEGCLKAVLQTPAHESVSILDEAHASVLAYADAMTLNVRVEDSIFQRLKQSFSDREIVEITATIAAYNCVSRFLVALDVGERNAQGKPHMR